MTSRSSKSVSSWVDFSLGEREMKLSAGSTGAVMAVMKTLYQTAVMNLGCCSLQIWVETEMKQ